MLQPCSFEIGHKKRGNQISHFVYFSFMPITMAWTHISVFSHEKHQQNEHIVNSKILQDIHKDYIQCNRKSKLLSPAH